MGRSVKKCLLGSAAILVLVGTGAAHAAEVASPYNWTGYYLGVTAGAAWGQYDAQTSTIPDGYDNAAQAAAVTAAGKQTVKATGFAAGIEGGYNWQTGNLLLGIEADLQAIHLNDAASSGAVPRPGAPGVAFTVTSYGNTNWLFTARPRIGFVAPNHWLFYATGGLALTQLQADFSYIDDNPAVAPFPGALETGQAQQAEGGLRCRCRHRGAAVRSVEREGRLPPRRVRQHGRQRRRSAICKSSIRAR